MLEYYASEYLLASHNPLELGLDLVAYLEVRFGVLLFVSGVSVFGIVPEREHLVLPRSFEVLGLLSGLSTAVPSRWLPDFVRTNCPITVTIVPGRAPTLIQYQSFE